MPTRLPPNPLIKGDTPLVAAARANHYECMLALLDEGADVEGRGTGGETPLIAAAAGGHLECVRTLLKSGRALVNGSDDQNRSALHQAAQAGHTAVVQLLLKHWAHRDALTSTGDTALLLAARTGNEATARVLLDAGADVSVRGRHDGHTALSHASRLGLVSLVKKMLQKRADPDARDNAGQTPAAHCKGRWSQYPATYSAVSLKRRRRVLEILHKASIGNGLWRRRAPVVMVYARHEHLRRYGCTLQFWSTPQDPKERKFKEMMDWLFSLHEFGMQELFRSCRRSGSFVQLC
ncbi:unnamed protein product [Chrysoparadoxa australica]